LDIEQINEDFNIVGCGYDETEYEIVAESFHNTDDNLAPNGCSTMDNLENDGYILEYNSDGS